MDDVLLNRIYTFGANYLTPTQTHAHMQGVVDSFNINTNQWVAW